MDILILSDLHIEFEPFYRSDAGADLVILAGDIGVGTQGVRWAMDAFPDTPVVYVLGNHEAYRQIYPDVIDECALTAAGSQVTVLENEFVDVGDYRIFGATLWTDFQLFDQVEESCLLAEQSMPDFSIIIDRDRDIAITPQRTIDYHQASLAWLEQALTESPAQQNIVVTHHLPSRKSVHDIYVNDKLSAAFASDLDEFILKHQPALWVHGHTHRPFDYRIQNTRVVCNPRGYPGEHGVSFDPNFLVTV